MTRSVVVSLRRRRGSEPSRGQSLVELSLVLIPFMFLLLGIVDLGRGIYIYNGVGQAAREIARTTSVHSCTGSPCTLGNSPETAATVATQKNLVPGLSDATAVIAYQCVDILDAAQSNTACVSQDFVRVTVSVRFQVLTPLLGLAGPMTFNSTSHIQIP